MVDSIMLDEKRVLPCAAYLEGEYGIDGLFMGVPVKLGASGIEAIVEVDLDDEERAALGRSADAVRDVVGVLTTVDPGYLRSKLPRVAPRLRVLRLVTPGRLLTLGATLFAVFLALWIIPSHKYIFLPDRAHPVAPLVTVAGGHDPADGGGIYFVDVVVRKATLLEELFGGLHDGADLYPASAVVPPGVSGSEQRTVDLSEMRRRSRSRPPSLSARSAGRSRPSRPARSSRRSSAAIRRPASSSRPT